MFGPNSQGSAFMPKKRGGRVDCSLHHGHEFAFIFFERWRILSMGHVAIG